MSTLTVYRVEDRRTGQGPYRIRADHSDEQADAVHEMTSRHSDLPVWKARFITTLADQVAHLHPGPEVDLGSKWLRMEYTQRSLDYLFGFPSQRRLGEWFFGERDTLELLDMHVAAYEVAHQAVVRGQWQLAFRKQSARRVATFELAGLVE